MFFKDFVSVKRKKIKKGASQTYDTPSFFFVLYLYSFSSLPNNFTHVQRFNTYFLFMSNKTTTFAH